MRLIQIWIMTQPLTNTHAYTHTLEIYFLKILQPTVKYQNMFVWLFTSSALRRKERKSRMLCSRLHSSAALWCQYRSGTIAIDCWEAAEWRLTDVNPRWPFQQRTHWLANHLCTQQRAGCPPHTPPHPRPPHPFFWQTCAAPHSGSFHRGRAALVNRSLRDGNMVFTDSAGEVPTIPFNTQSR